MNLFSNTRYKYYLCSAFVLRWIKGRFPCVVTLFDYFSTEVTVPVSTTLHMKLSRAREWKFVQLSRICKNILEHLFELDIKRIIMMIIIIINTGINLWRRTRGFTVCCEYRLQIKAEDKVKQPYYICNANQNAKALTHLSNLSSEARDQTIWGK